MKTWLGTVGAIFALGSVAQAAGRDAVQLQTPLDGAGAAARETTLGDMVADAVRQAGGADIALVAADEITDADVPAGAVPPERIVKTLRYADDPSDTVVVLTLTGAQITKIAERSVARAPQSFDGFLQVSGLQVHYDPAQPEGKRITQAAVAGSAVQPTHTYRVATTRPVADGSFGYFRFWSSSDITEDTHTSIAAAVTSYLSTHKTIHATLENRITP